MIQSLTFHIPKPIRFQILEAVIWFVAKDVCEALGIVWKGSATMGPLQDDEIQTFPVKTDGGTQDVVHIDESGLYRLAFKSRKPYARHFTRWVTHEVLPSIRRTGSYSLPDGVEFTPFGSAGPDNPSLPSSFPAGPAGLLPEAIARADGYAIAFLGRVMAEYPGRRELTVDSRERRWGTRKSVGRWLRNLHEAGVVRVDDHRRWSRQSYTFHVL